MSTATSVDDAMQRLNLLQLTTGSGRIYGNGGKRDTATLLQVFLNAKGLLTALTLFAGNVEIGEGMNWQQTLMPLSTIVSQLTWPISYNFDFGEWLYINRAKVAKRDSGANKDIWKINKNEIKRNVWSEVTFKVNSASLIFAPRKFASCKLIDTSHIRERCRARDKVAICLFMSRRKSVPRYVALVPVSREDATEGSYYSLLMNDGFKIVYLPYTFYVRHVDFKGWYSLENHASDKGVAICKKLVRKLRLKCHPSRYKCP
uniref:Ku domain-containing protein n=1 Tax=Glossina palpalis gambiensis TaxID=67801 RepID=A0A1B0C3D3_9MUSC